MNHAVDDVGILNWSVFFLGRLLKIPYPSSEPQLLLLRVPDFYEGIQLIINVDLMTLILHSARRRLAPNAVCLDC